VTSGKARRFVERLGSYEHVVTYDDVASLPPRTPTVLMDLTGSAMATRFCTSTWAMFTLVPSSKVTSRVYEPSLLLCDDMYSIPSTPTTCCSIGAAQPSTTPVETL